MTRGQPRVVIIITYSGFEDRVWRTYQPVVFSREGFHVNIKCYLNSAHITLDHCLLIWVYS